MREENISCLPFSFMGEQYVSFRIQFIYFFSVFFPKHPLSVHYDSGVDAGSVNHGLLQKWNIKFQTKPRFMLKTKHFQGHKWPHTQLSSTLPQLWKVVLVDWITNGRIHFYN